MKSLDGQFLIAMPNMGDHRFERTVIFLCAHSRDGAMGFVINKVLEKPTVADFLRQLEIVTDGERDQLPQSLRTDAVHTGGPVEPGRGFVLHTPDYHHESTLKVCAGVSLTATLEILRAIATGRGPAQAMMALGYSGWAGGQLEEEIASNGWLTVPCDPCLIFDRSHETKYERALRLLGVDPLLLSSEAGHA